MTPQREEAERLIRLAKRDLAAATALLAAPEVPPAVACFHAQQSVEKALKAVMCINALPFKRTHDLEELAGSLREAMCPPPIAETCLRRLTPYAVEFRYDDEAPHLIEASLARDLANTVLTWAEDMARSLEN